MISGNIVSDSVPSHPPSISSFNPTIGPKGTEHRHVFAGPQICFRIRLPVFAT